MLLLPLLLTVVAAQEPPAAAISNGLINAKLYLPDAKTGYYRGTRFDWGGVIASLKAAGHEYFGVWFERYDPKLHDAITGPVEEFLTSNGSSLGYDEAAPGGTFIRIGVGVLRKQKDAPFQRFGYYDIVDSGKWKVTHKKDSITFQHTLRDPATGYAYLYRKTVRLVPGVTEMMIEHSLKNTGTKAIDTAVYNHNFFMLDGQTTGPDVTVGFNFTPQAKADFKGLAEIRGKELAYPRELRKGETAMSEITGFDPAKASDHEFRVINSKTGATVRMTADKPLSKIIYWSIPTVLSPEGYISMRIEPGQESNWSLRYEFSSVKR